MLTPLGSQCYRVHDPLTTDSSPGTGCTAGTQGDTMVWSAWPARGTGNTQGCPANSPHTQDMCALQTSQDIRINRANKSICQEDFPLLFAKIRALSRKRGCNYANLLNSHRQLDARCQLHIRFSTIISPTSHQMHFKSTSSFTILIPIPDLIPYFPDTRHVL